MTTVTDNNQTDYLDTAITVVLSLILGVMGGLVILASGWLLTTTPVGAALAQTLAITEKTPWYFTRSAGTVAYLLLASSTIWGLLLSTKLLKDHIPAALLGRGPLLAVEELVNVVFPSDAPLLIADHADLDPQTIDESLERIGEKWKDLAPRLAGKVELSIVFGPGLVVMVAEKVRCRKGHTRL